MQLAAIVAVDKNNVIGRDLDIPWYLPDDFKYFKEKTLNHPIIMGKNTWLSIGKALPKRLNIIISTTIDKSTLPEGVLCFKDIHEAIAYLTELNPERAFIIGGGQLYAATLNMVDTVLLTRVQANIEDGNVFFPKLNPTKWTLTSALHHDKDEKHEYAFSFEVWQKNK